MKKIVKLILVIIWCLVIFMFSNDNREQSTKKSDTVIVVLAKVLGQKNLNKIEKDKLIDKYVVLVRKGAHFIVYFILGILLSSLISEYIPLSKKEIFIAIFLSFIYACSDEVHQLFVGRSGEIKDILLDTVGASIGVCSYNLFIRIFDIIKHIIK